jgi:putative N-acetyltransferase (TIGR04045 family)
MLEVENVWGGSVPAFLSPSITAQIACELWELEGYFALRRAIFAEEQGLFETSDVDAKDAFATPIVALTHVAGIPDEVVGGVRIYPEGSGTWFGGRLGVCQRYRARGVVGTALIYAAVSTAHAKGCNRFLATIQLKNVTYFERHAFSVIGPVEVCGQPHQLMEADLGVYPPRAAHAAQAVDGALVAALFRSRKAA